MTNPISLTEKMRLEFKKLTFELANAYKEGEEEEAEADIESALKMIRGQKNMTLSHQDWSHFLDVLSHPAKPNAVLQKSYTDIVTVAQYIVQINQFLFRVIGNLVGRPAANTYEAMDTACAALGPVNGYPLFASTWEGDRISEKNCDFYELWYDPNNKVCGWGVYEQPPHRSMNEPKNNPNFG